MDDLVGRGAECSSRNYSQHLLSEQSFFFFSEGKRRIISYRNGL